MTGLPGSVTLLGGGTGTPKLIQAGTGILDDVQVTVIANTADDVEFGDLFVCPDVDASLFAAAGVIDRERWWGLAEDSTKTADALDQFAQALDMDGPPKFRASSEQTEGRDIARWRRFEPVPEFMLFGDADRAIHRVRAAALDAGRPLTAVTRDLGRSLGVPIDVLPMSDDPVATIVHTPGGALHFQEFWVARRGAPQIESVEFRGVDSAGTTASVDRALDADLIVIGPSNPVTSIGPILELSGVRDRLDNTTVVAVSPFLGPEAFSGPAVELMDACGMPTGTPGLDVAYPFVDAVIIDEADPSAVGPPTVRTDIRIATPDDADRVWSAVGEAYASIR